MLPLDRSTRDLLPSCDGDRVDVIISEIAFAGSLVPAIAVPLPATLVAMQAAAELPLVEHAAGGEPATMPIKGTESPIAAFSGSVTLGEAAHGTDIAPIYAARILHRELAGDPGHAQDRQDGRRELDGDDGGDGVNHVANDHGEFAGFDDVHRIDVTQIVLVDQDAGIIVNGYVGEVVARLHIDQDLSIEQDVDIAFTIDGNGHFIVLVDQELRIDQEIEIDLEIFDIDGVLYVDLYLRDAIEVEQDTSIDMRIGDGPPGGTVAVNQNIELDQDVDISIDIEDELEERYIIEVTIEIRQQADVDQDAIVDIGDLNGEIDMNVDAIQTASIEQQTLVQADFLLI